MPSSWFFPPHHSILTGKPGSYQTRFLETICAGKIKQNVFLLGLVFLSSKLQGEKKERIRERNLLHCNQCISTALKSQGCADPSCVSPKHPAQGLAWRGWATEVCASMYKWRSQTAPFSRRTLNVTLLEMWPGCSTYWNFHNEPPTNTIVYEYPLCSPNPLWPMDTTAENESCFYHCSHTSGIFNTPAFPEVALSGNGFCNNGLPLPLFPSPPSPNPRIAEQVFTYQELPQTRHNLSSISYQSHKDNLLSFGVQKEYLCFIYI